MTERGCRSDRGLCFARLGWWKSQEALVVQFTDGSVYRVPDVSQDAYKSTWANHPDPGCAANGDGIGLKAFGATRIASWPSGVIDEATPPGYATQ